MNSSTKKWLAGCGGLAILVIFGCCVIGLVANLAGVGPVSDSVNKVDLPTLTPTGAPVVIADTAMPTDTPVPTAPPDPIVLSGSGDAVQDVAMWNGPAIMQVQGNDDSRHFAVIPHTVSGEMITAVVNTTNPYQGRVLLSEPVNRLEISAPGAWTVEILPLSAARTLAVPGQIAGNGDDVLVLVGGQPDTAMVTGNQAGRHFAVMPYTPAGQSILGGMVNTTDPYEGEILLDDETRILDIRAVGPWSIAISE